MTFDRRQFIETSLGAAALICLPRELWAAPNLEVALRAERWIRQSRMPTEHGVVWPAEAEHRVQPDLLVAQTGLMQGAAGVGTFFLHLNDYSRRIALPDNPF